LIDGIVYAATTWLNGCDALYYGEELDNAWNEVLVEVKVEQPCQGAVHCNYSGGVEVKGLLMTGGLISCHLKKKDLSSNPN
jgi:hypothetical protein